MEGAQRAFLDFYSTNGAVSGHSYDLTELVTFPG